jgi:hypothetical protein
MISISENILAPRMDILRTQRHSYHEGGHLIVGCSSGMVPRVAVLQADPASQTGAWCQFENYDHLPLASVVMMKTGGRAGEAILERLGGGPGAAKLADLLHALLNPPVFEPVKVPANMDGWLKHRSEYAVARSLDPALILGDEVTAWLLARDHGFDLAGFLEMKAACSLRALEILMEKRSELDSLASTLIIRGRLDGAEIAAVMGGR